MLAIGIASYSLIAVFGLLVNALNTFKNSRSDQMYALVTQRAVSEIRQSNFSDLAAGTLYFSFEGEPVESPSSDFNGFAVVYSFTPRPQTVPGTQFHDNEHVANIAMAISRVIDNHQLPGTQHFSFLIADRGW